jgi:hypothetical protein
VGDAVCVAAWAEVAEGVVVALAARAAIGVAVRAALMAMTLGNNRFFIEGSPFSDMTLIAITSASSTSGRGRYFEANKENGPSPERENGFRVHQNASLRDIKPANVQPNGNGGPSRPNGLGFWIAS